MMSNTDDRNFLIGTRDKLYIEIKKSVPDVLMENPGSSRSFEMNLARFRFGERGGMKILEVDAEHFEDVRHHVAIAGVAKSIAALTTDRTIFHYDPNTETGFAKG